MKFCIITPCLNRKAFIAEAIESVLEQQYADFEHWIIDGQSTDGTLELLQCYPHLRVVSESDRGVYDALNKGLERSTGDIVGFLNSDDVYVPGTFRLVSEIFTHTVGTLVVSGGCQIFQRTSDGTEVEMHRYENGRLYHLSFRNATLGLPLINGRFFRRSVFNRVGRFDLRYAIASDRDLLIRMALANIPDAPVSRVLYRYQWHAGSLTMNAGTRTSLAGAEECLAIAGDLAQRSGLDRAARHDLTVWRRVLQANKVLVLTSMGEFGTALRMFATLAKDPRWLLTFLRCGGLAVARRLRTKYRTFRKRK